MTFAAEPRVAVVGCGQWGRNLVRTFHQLGSLAAVSDTAPDRAAAVAEEFGVPAESLESILTDGTLDAVVVATPAVDHASIAQQALLAGKHVFVEKPLALQLADGEQLCKIAEATGRILMVGHLLRYHPAFERLADSVADGTIGRLLYVYSNRLNFGRFRREENILWSFAPHDLSMILSLAGVEPASVWAVGLCHLRPFIADVTTTHLSFGNGLQAHVFVSWLHPYKEHRLVAVGDRGMLVFNDGLPWDSKLTLYPHQVDWRDGVPLPAPAEGRPLALLHEEPLLRECRHFIECCAGASTPRTDGHEGLRVLRVLNAAQESMTSGDQVPGNPPRARNASGRSTAHLSRPYSVHDSSYVDEPSEIGEGTRIWHFSHVLEGTKIGRNCTIGQNVCIGPNVVVGNGCKVQNNVSLYSGVVLEDDVFCGPSAVFTNVRNPRAAIDRRSEFEPTHVGRGATIGANATIVCGTTIGAHSFVAAGAVVTRDVEPYALVAGIPARRVGWVSEAGEKLGPDLTCPRTGRRYREVEGHLEEIVE